MNRACMMFPGGRFKAFTMSYDDGVEQDVKLIALMKKHAVKGTFNLNSGLFAKEGTVYPTGQVHRRMTRQMCLKAYDHEVCEVAVHGYEHLFWPQLPEGRRTLEIIKDRDTLENDFGCIVRGAAYPYGWYDAASIEALKNAGLVYCRTVHSTHSFRIPENWLALDPTCHHDDAMLDELASKFISLNKPGEPALFYLWGHAYEFEGNNNWARIEALLDKIGGIADIWYATNIEVYDYVQAFKQLIYSADGSRVYNPTNKALWLWDGREAHLIASGEKVII